jgi:hypothetical protein
MTPTTGTQENTAHNRSSKQQDNTMRPFSQHSNGKDNAFSHTIPEND